ncbi:MAG: hypothetical protein HY813_03460 [Candidatus Portnoybacteria bacterium]|nr:hypothetical protein [Candidatus Portnoybacteria bacterium]
MLQACAVLLSLVIIFVFLKIYGEMRYSKGQKDKHEEIVKNLLTPARYDAFKLDCYPPPEIKLHGQLIVVIEVTECMHKKTKIKFIEE